MIEAAALVPAEPQEVFAFLSDLGNHWRLASRFVEVVELESARNGDSADRGVVRLRGPLGLHRTARTTVKAARAPRLIIGTAEIAGGTRARVSWTLGQRLGQTRVRLAAVAATRADVDVIAKPSEQLAPRDPDVRVTAQNRNYEAEQIDQQLQSLATAPAAASVATAKTNSSRD